jgi:hypothetical protein
MKKQGYFLSAMIILFIFGCAAGFKDIKVDSTSDPKANLSSYKTYAWLGSAQIVWDEKGQWEPPQFDADAEVKFLINREMRKLDMSEVNNDPDLFIGYAAGIDIDALDLKMESDTSAIKLENIPKAALVIVFIDAQTGFPIWVAEAEGNAAVKPDTETAKKRLDYAVKKMFKQLPK